MSSFVSRLREPVITLRSRVRSMPGGTRAWQVGVLIVGAAVVIGGIILLPLPGPGWLIIFLGLSVLASEFVWAARLLNYGRQQLTRFTEWASRQPVWIRVAGGLLTALAAAAVVVAWLAWKGWWPF